LCHQATAEANNLAAVAKSKDLYVTEMEKVVNHPSIILYYQFVFINSGFEIQFDLVYNSSVILWVCIEPALQQVARQICG